MSLIRAEGIVVRARNLGDADKVVTLFTREAGKLRASARGARRVRSQLLAVTQPFAYGSYLVFKNRNLHNLSQGQLEKPFRRLREDLTTMAYAAYFAEIADVGVPEEEINEGFFQLLLASFEALEEEKAPPKLIARWYELQAMDNMGFRPELESCVSCGQPASADTARTLRFSVVEGGYTCSNCGNNGESLSLSRSCYQGMRYLLGAAPAGLARLRLDGEGMQCMENILARYIEYRLERKLNSISFLHSINTMAP